jgi:hypothetical protein
VNAAPVIFSLASRPQKVRDFDFLSSPTGMPRIAAALGSEVVVFSIGVE